MSTLLKTSSAPHIRTNESINKIMWTVIATLVPIIIFSVYNFGFCALQNIIICAITSMAVEMVCLVIRGKSIKASFDGSALLTGILLAFNIPPSSPWWMAIVGSIVAIVIAKQAFGGLGYNIFNPALIARAFLLTAWPVDMTTWQLHGVTGATPLGMFKEHGFDVVLSNYSSHLSMYWHMFFGETGGCIGETSELLILLGGLFLMYKKIISWHTPITYIGTAFLLGWMFGGNGFMQCDPLFYIFSGGLFLGAFYMATDMVTTPLTKKGKIVFGLGCGFFTFLIRKFSAFPEGVSYSILLMNSVTPLIDKYIDTKMFGINKQKGDKN